MSEINWLIDWYLTPTLAVFRLYRGVEIYWLLLDINPSSGQLAGCARQFKHA
jgi:hypothetical protein